MSGFDFLRESIGTGSRFIPRAAERCAACGEPDPDGPTASDGKPWCAACHEAGEVSP